MPWRAIKWVAGILVLVIVVFLYGVVPWFFTNIVTKNGFHYHDVNAGKTPASFGMSYSEIAFRSRDGISLKGWYVPAGDQNGDASLGTIVYCHGFHRDRVEMLPMAQFGHQLHYDGVLFDFRNHGRSGGKVTSLGYWERLDAEAAVNQAVMRQPAGRPAILWGVSMGAAAALMAAAEDPQVSAVISDSTFLSFDRVIKHHYVLIRSMIRRRWWWFPPLPSFPLTDEVIAWSARRAHFDPADFDLEDAVKRIGPRPILFVAVSGDVRMPPRIAKTLYADAQSSQKMLSVVPGTRHGEGFREGNAEYEKAVSEFLTRVQAVPAPGAAATQPIGSR